MEDNHNANQELNALFWKEEILQVLYWMEGEELGEEISFEKLVALLNTSSDHLQKQLVRNEEAGLIKRNSGAHNETFTVGLTPAGKKEAGLIFKNAFEGMQKAGHGECGPDCEFCYQDGEKLENCVHNCAENHAHKYH
ncbi:MAG: hypothetical protein ABIQ02_11460 [Saprospiraceae bacterium]